METRNGRAGQADAAQRVLRAAVAKATEAGGMVALEPFDALDGGRLAVLVDPTGAVIAAWQVGENRGAQLVNEPGAWSMSVLHTRDVEAAKAFYSAVFGWGYGTFGQGAGGMTLPLVPGYAGGEPEQPVSRETVAVLADMSGFRDEAPAHWGVDFWIADADAAVAKATELGGKVVNPATDSHGFRSAVLADPQGAVFTISQFLVG